MEEEFFESELIKRFEEMIEHNEEYYFDSEELEEVVIHYLEMGDISFAELSVDFALRLHPNSLELKTKKLEVLLDLEQYTMARELIEELRNASMETTDFLVCCAKYYSNLGNPRRAIEYCQKALKLEDEENFLHNFIADEYVNLEDPFNALRHYKKALKYDPDDDYALENVMNCYHRLKKNDEAIVFLKNYLDEFPFSETAWFEYGQFYFNRRNYKEAIKGFDYLLAISPQSMGVYGNKAACYEAMGQWQNAIKVYEELLELEYTKAFTFYKIGLCYKAMKEYVVALNMFQQASREDPQFYMAMMEQSEIYYEMGKLQEALYFAKEAASYNETSLDYQKKLAFLYIDSEKFEESLFCLRKITDMEPDSFYNWYAYSEVLMLIGEYEEAILILEKAVKIHHRAELFYQMSNCYFHLKEEEKGKEFLDIAVRLDPFISEDMQQKYPYIRKEIREKEKGENKNS